MSILVEDASREAGGQHRGVTLARADKRNALDAEHLAALGVAFDIGKDEDIRTVLLRAEGPAFCAGYDVSHGGVPNDAEVVRVMGLVRRCPSPVVAAVQGPAFGAGFELALSADLRVASTAATFCLPAARLGIAYAVPGLARLLSVVGHGWTRRILFTGEVVDAATALRIGLVDEVVPAEQLTARAVALAATTSALAPAAVRAMKLALNALEPVLPALEADQYAWLRERCFASDDAAEGLAALREKRPARFGNR